MNDDRAGGRSKFSVRDVLADMEAQGLSPRTRQQARAILRIALGAAVGFVAYYGFNSSPRLTTLGALAILGAGLSGLVTRRGRETPLTRRTATVAAVGVALTAAPLAVNVGNFNSSLLNEWWGGFAIAVDALLVVPL